MCYNRERICKKSLTEQTMKAKKIFSAIALAMGFTVLASCTDASTTFTLGEYWKYNSLITEEIHEVVTYDVTFNDEDYGGMNNLGYTVSYDNGTYKTVLKSETKDGEVIYNYATEFSIDVTYTCNDEEETFTDTVVSSVSFYGADKKLQPIYSTKTTVSHSPMIGDDQTSTKYCYSVFNQTVETNYKGEEWTCVVIDHTLNEGDKGYKTTDTFEKDEKLTFFDNEQLLVAARAFGPSVLSGKAQTYQQVIDNTQNVKYTFADSDEEEGREFSLLINDAEETVKKKISYRTVSLVFDDKNPGATQTAWIATGGATKNTYRNIMLYLETPLSYGIGKLVYTINGVSGVLS